MESSESKLPLIIVAIVVAVLAAVLTGFIVASNTKAVEGASFGNGSLSIVDVNGKDISSSNDAYGKLSKSIAKASFTLSETRTRVSFTDGRTAWTGTLFCWAETLAASAPETKTARGIVVWDNALELDGKHAVTASFVSVDWASQPMPILTLELVVDGAPVDFLALSSTHISSAAWYADAFAKAKAAPDPQDGEGTRAVEPFVVTYTFEMQPQD